MYIDKKTLAILALTISAILLVFGNMGGHAAKADTVLADRDYQLITAKANSGGDNLYIYDGGSGILAVYVYDPNIQGMRAKAYQSVSNIFARTR